MKKIISLALALVMLVLCASALTACGTEGDIYVQTNAYFAPFEYYDGSKIVGVDVEIMNRVGKKLNKNVVWQDGDFGIIIDVVSEGKLADCGAAGITITDERSAKVDFSKPYYTSIQYVVVPADSDVATKTVGDTTYVVWEALAGKRIGTQTDTTGAIYTDGEINAQESDENYGYNGVLYNTGTEHVQYDSAQLAADALGLHCDVVIIDELPAQYITSNNEGFKCYPLYYSGSEGEADSPVIEDYAIAVTKGNTELLNAINEVLDELLQKDADGKTGIEKMVMEHMGLDK